MSQNNWTDDGAWLALGIAALGAAASAYAGQRTYEAPGFGVGRGSSNDWITATITARGADSAVPDNAGAVDATIYAGGAEVGEVTLVPDGEWNGGGLVAWGSLDHWADYALQAWMSANGIDPAAVVQAVQAAHRATS